MSHLHLRSRARTVPAVAAEGLPRRAVGERSLAQALPLLTDIAHGRDREVVLESDDTCSRSWSTQPPPRPSGATCIRSSTGPTSSPGCSPTTRLRFPPGRARPRCRCVAPGVPRAGSGGMPRGWASPRTSRAPTGCRAGLPTRWTPTRRPPWRRAPAHHAGIAGPPARHHLADRRGRRGPPRGPVREDRQGVRVHRARLRRPGTGPVVHRARGRGHPGAGVARGRRPALRAAGRQACECLFPISLPSRHRYPT